MPRVDRYTPVKGVLLVAHVRHSITGVTGVTVACTMASWLHWKRGTTNGRRDREWRLVNPNAPRMRRSPSRTKSATVRKRRG
jgi:hypothetical protein